MVLFVNTFLACAENQSVPSFKLVHMLARCSCIS